MEKDDTRKEQVKRLIKMIESATDKQVDLIYRFCSNLLRRSK